MTTLHTQRRITNTVGLRAQDLIRSQFFFAVSLSEHRVDVAADQALAVLAGSHLGTAQTQCWLGNHVRFAWGTVSCAPCAIFATDQRKRIIGELSAIAFRWVTLLNSAYAKVRSSNAPKWFLVNAPGAIGMWYRFPRVPCLRS